MPHGIGEISVLSEPWTSENPQTGITRKAAHAARDLSTRHQKIPLKNEFDTHFFSFTSRLSFPNTLLRPAVAEGALRRGGSLCGRAAPPLPALRAAREGPQGKAALQEQGIRTAYTAQQSHWELRSHHWGRECSWTDGKERKKPQKHQHRVTAEG